jgi:hypothetical protein
MDLSKDRIKSSGGRIRVRAPAPFSAEDGQIKKEVSSGIPLFRFKQRNRSIEL